MSTHSIKQSINIITLNKIKSKWNAMSSKLVKCIVKMDMPCHHIQSTFGTHITIANQNLTNQNTTFDIHVTFGD
jgi:hypothetical protein